MKEKGNEELKLFALYFILIDLDFKENKKYIEEFGIIAKQNLIKYGILLKLYNYLIFRKTNDIDFLKKSIIAQQRRIDSSKKAMEVTGKLLHAHEKKIFSKKS